MEDDFSEFCSRVGQETSCYGECQVCGDLFIRDIESYDKPKMECDPDRIDNCKFWLPVCDCDSGRILYDDDALEKCTYPDCECGPGTSDDPGDG